MPTARRRLRSATAVGAAVVVLASAVPAAGASGTSGSTHPATSSTSGLAAEAARLTTRIEDQGVALAKLSERFDAAVIHERSVDSALARDRRATTSTRRRSAVVHAELVRLAVASYVDGAEALPVPPSPGRAGSDPSLTIAYAAVVAGDEHRALARWGSLEAQLTVDTRHLERTRRQATLAVTSLRRAARQARSAQQAERTLLASVKGRLAAAVHADQVAARRAEAARVRASLDSSAATAGRPYTAPAGTDPVGSAAASTAAPAGDRAGTSPSSPSPGTAATGTSGPTTTPSTTTPPTTTPPTTTPPTTTPPTTTPPTTKVPAATTTTVSEPPAGTPTSVPPSSPSTSAPTTVPAQAPGADRAIAYARAQLGKPYQWGGSGPASFDCSGLVMMAWEQAGIDFPHLAQDQYDLTAREPLSDLLPGDLVFFGTPNDVYHVGLYIGGGQMIDAPETGQDVSSASIYWPGLLGAGRVTTSS